jgi:hypothetical protein
METASLAEFNAISEALREVEEAVPTRWSDALAVDRKADAIRVRADLFKLRKHNYELVYRTHVLELRTPTKRFRVVFKGVAPESELSGGLLIITFRSQFEAPGEPALEALGRATWRATHAAKGVKRVFVTRAINAVVDLAEKNAESSLEAATTAGSDWEVLLRALSSTDVVEVTPGADPLANARLRGIHAKRGLLDAEGGSIAASEVARILGISRQAVDKRRQAGTLLAIRAGGHGYRYPAWQFEESGVLDGLERVLKALARHDEWMKLAFFVNSNVRLDDESPLQRMRRSDVAAVLQAAEAYGEHGAA